jgi:hypothetical protein
MISLKKSLHFAFFFIIQNIKKEYIEMYYKNITEYLIYLSI